MKFIRVGDEMIQLGLVTHIKEGAKDETLYGRSVRKTTDHRFGWLEVHFVSGEAIKVEGEAAKELRELLEEELKAGRESAPAPTPVSALAHIPHRRAATHEGPHAETSVPASAPTSITPRHEHAPRPSEEPRISIRNGFGR